MRTLLIAALVTAPALAHADPLAVHAALEDAPRTYAAAGVAIGGAAGRTMLGGSAELGMRVSDHLIIHADVLAGDDSELFGPRGTYIAVTGGIDATTCPKVERVCAYAGFGAGYAQSTSSDSDWFTGGTSSMNEHGATGMLRAGMDLGGKHVRWRPGFAVSLFGPAGGAFTNSISFRF